MWHYNYSSIIICTQISNSIIILSLKYVHYHKCHMITLQPMQCRTVFMWEKSYFAKHRLNSFKFPWNWDRNCSGIWRLMSVAFTGTVLALLASKVYLTGAMKGNGVWSRLMISYFGIGAITRLEFRDGWTNDTSEHCKNWTFTVSKT